MLPGRKRARKPRNFTVLRTEKMLEGSKRIELVTHKEGNQKGKVPQWNMDSLSVLRGPESQKFAFWRSEYPEMRENQERGSHKLRELSEATTESH